MISGVPSSVAGARYAGVQIGRSEPVGPPPSPRGMDGTAPGRQRALHDRGGLSEDENMESEE